jgi:hypothetical protein
MIVYVWSRRNAQVMMNFLGVFNFYAPVMPWVLLGFTVLLSGQIPTTDLLGIAAGHIYFYFSDVYPILYEGSRPLATPSLISRLFDPHHQYLGESIVDDGSDVSDELDEQDEQQDIKVSYGEEVEDTGAGVGVFGDDEEEEEERLSDNYEKVKDKKNN